MHRKRVNQFEAYLQQAARGETADGDLAPLAGIARSVSAVDVPPPPRGLVDGRRRLAAEAARLNRRRRVAWARPGATFVKMRAVAVVVSLLVVLAVLPGLTHAVATSDAGSPLYPIKLFGQEARLQLTHNPEEVADLQVSIFEEQLDGIATSLEQGLAIDPAIAGMAQVRLSLAVDAVNRSAEASGAAPKLRLTKAIQEAHQRILQLCSAGLGAEQDPLHNLMRQMEHARLELHPGNGLPDGEQEQAREGTPPADQEFGTHGPAGSAPGLEATRGAGAPAAADPGPTSDPCGNQAGAAGPGTPDPAWDTAQPTAAPGQQPGPGGDQPQSPPKSGGDNARDNR